MKSRLDAIAVLNRNIRVDGCLFTEVSLEFTDMNADTLAQASACLQMVDRCEEWWWGDYMVAYAELRLRADYSAEDIAKMSEQDQENVRLAYVRNHGSVVNGEELADTQYRRYKVSSFYKSRTRVRELTPRHHRYAMEGSGGDLAMAQEWLDRAKQSGWSANELRTEIKGAKKGDVSDPPSKVVSYQHELFGAQRWAHVQLPRVPDMEIEEIDRMLADLAPLVTLAQSLATARAARANECASISYPTANAGGKESLTVAA